MSIKTDHIFFACMLFFVMALSSCTKEIDYRGNETDPLLIVEASLEPNMWYDKRDNVTYYGMLYFTIQSTQFFLDTAKNSLLFEDIECYLQHNDDPFIELYKPIYKIRKPINVGDVFRLKVSHPDYPTVTTKIVVPDLNDIVVKIDTNSLKFVPHGILKQPSYQFDVVVDSKTKCASNNVILLKASTTMKMDTLDKSFRYCWSDDPIIANNLLYQDYSAFASSYQEQNLMYSPIVLPISEITTWPYRFSLMIPAEVVNYSYYSHYSNGKEEYWTEEARYYFDYCYLNISITNPEYLEYLRVMQAVQNGGASILSEPVVVTSPNVEGGLGYFNVEKSFSVKLTKDIISELLSE
jgi:hypothetical protein